MKAVALFVLVVAIVLLTTAAGPLRPATPARLAGVGSLAIFEGRPGDRFQVARRGIDADGLDTSLVPAVAWSSSNPAVAIVESTMIFGQEAVVTLGSPGEATITVRSVGSSSLPSMTASVLVRCEERGAVAIAIEAHELSPIPPLGF